MSLSKGGKNLLKLGGSRHESEADSQTLRVWHGREVEAAFDAARHFAVSPTNELCRGAAVLPQG
jgi:hypothetical protein